MAPDLNSLPSSAQPSLPTSRRASNTSRRASNQLPPPSPSLLLASPTMTNILPSNQSAVAQSHGNSSSLSSPFFATMGDGQGIAGPGPLRHPRPVTAADLHMELEKEQEAVVNRLTRELSILRASQNASVASNASSTSAASAAHHETQELPPHGGYHASPPHSLPPRRHQRSGSSTSIRSITGASVTNENIAGVAPERPRSIMYRSDSNTHVPSTISTHDRISVSRQNSTNSTSNQTPYIHRTMSGTSSPEHGTNSASHSSTRPSLPAQLSRQRSNSSILNIEERLSSTSIPTTARFDEVMQHKQELDNAKRENEQLKARIRELEILVRQSRDNSNVPAHS